MPSSARLERAIVTDETTGQSLNVAGGQLGVTNFYLEVAKGNVPGHSIINKFGHNAAATTGDDIWSGGGAYGFYPTTGQLLEVVSTSTEDDDTTGDGTWTILVSGLDANMDLQTATVILNGTGVVAIPTLLWRRVYRAVCLTGGVTGTNEGTITIRIASAGTTAAVIAVGDGQTQMAIYTIPNNHTGYFLKGYTALANATFQGELGNFQWLLRPNNGDTGQWAVQGQIGLVNVGSSHWQYEYGAPAGPLPEMTDIKIKMSSASDTMDSVGGFDILLVADGYKNTRRIYYQDNQ